MNVPELIARVRADGAAAIVEEDRRAFAYRLGSGRLLRRELVDCLLADYSAADLPLIRELMREKLTARTEHHGGGRVLFGLTLMLFALANLEDTLLVHRAKYCNMDAGTMLDARLLTMQHDNLTVRRWVQQRLDEHPTESTWSVERVVADVDRAFAWAAASSEEDWVAAAWAELETAYGEDLIDEDADRG